jgi:hypothetical protein
VREKINKKKLREDIRVGVNHYVKGERLLCIYVLYCTWVLGVFILNLKTKTENILCSYQNIHRIVYKNILKRKQHLPSR